MSWSRPMLLALCVSSACQIPGPHLPRSVVESSGIVKSATYDDVFWTHDDSGNWPRLFAVDGSGALLGIKTLNVDNLDWEDIARGPDGALYVADIGNNASSRANLVVHRVPEPVPSGNERIEVDASFRFRYPDQRLGEPGPSNFDAEALVFWKGTLWVFTKHRDDQRTTAYRFPSLDPDAEVVLEKVSSFDLGGKELSFGGMATAADVSDDGEHLVILTYHAIFFFALADDDPLAAPVRSIELDSSLTRQCEAVAWDGEGLVITNEAGRIFRLGDPLESDVTRFPGSAKPATPR